MQQHLILEIGKTYKSRDGRYVKIFKGNPPINGERVGWDGIYWGNSIDDLDPKLDYERYIFDGKWWSYLFPNTQLSDYHKDLIEVIDENDVPTKSDLFQSENDYVTQNLNLNDVFSLQIKMDIKILKNDTHEYLCLIDEKKWGVGVTPMFALTKALEKYKETFE
jgi:hypothetical protein